RRQWSLADRPDLRYAQLNAFDAAMQRLDREFGLLADPPVDLLWLHEANKQLVYRRGRLVFVFNWSGGESYTDWRIPVPDQRDYRIVLDSDAPEFGGHGRVTPDTRFIWNPTAVGEWQQSIQIYSPSR